MRSRYPMLFAVAVAVAVVCAGQAHARPCATLELLEFGRRGDLQAAIGITARPEGLRATFDSLRHPLRVHAGPGADDARALWALGVLEAAWDAQVGGAGFPAPLPDGTGGGDPRFDVYLVPLPASVGGMTVATGDTAPRDGRRTSPAFMLLDPALPDDLLEVYAHHELQHALQFALDTRESLMWAEASAVYWEVRARPDVTDWHLALEDFQANPDAPLYATGAVVEDLMARSAPRYEYGAVLFALYLDEVHGDRQGTLLGRVWELAAPVSPADDNEPDFLDAIAQAGVDVATVVADFAGWRALVGPWAVPDDGPSADTPAASLVAAWRLAAARLDGTVEVTQGGPYPLGCAVRAVVAPDNVESMPVSIAAEASETGRDIALAVLVVEDDPRRVTRTSTGPGARHTTEVAVPGAATLQLAVCDVSAVDPDDVAAPHPVRISLRRTDVDPPDAGEVERDAGAAVDGGEEPALPPPDCSCQSTSGDPKRMRTGIGVVGLLLGFVGFGVRGYRMWKRKRLYRR